MNTKNADRRETMRAIEQVTTGNFLVMPDNSQQVVAVISWCSEREGKREGWRVFSNIKERRSGHLRCATPEDAAHKYFKEPVTFTRLNSPAAESIRPSQE